MSLSESQKKYDDMLKTQIDESFGRTPLSDVMYSTCTLSEAVEGMSLSNMGFNGYIYALSNPSMPGLLKVGMTTRDLEHRIKELSSSSGVPTPFELESYFLSKDCANDEYQIHNDLKEYRLTSGREFFSCSLSDFKNCAIKYSYPADTKLTDAMYDKKYFALNAYNTSSTHPVNIESSTLENLKCLCAGDVGTIATQIIQYFMDSYEESLLVTTDGERAVVKFFPSVESVELLTEQNFQGGEK